jgi:hypothetical protein
MVRAAARAVGAKAEIRAMRTKTALFLTSDLLAIPLV